MPEAQSFSSWRRESSCNLNSSSLLRWSNHNMPWWRSLMIIMELWNSLNGSWMLCSWINHHVLRHRNHFYLGVWHHWATWMNKLRLSVESRNTLNPLNRHSSDLLRLTKSTLSMIAVWVICRNAVNHVGVMRHLILWRWHHNHRIGRSSLASGSPLVYWMMVLLLRSHRRLLNQRHWHRHRHLWNRLGLWYMIFWLLRRRRMGRSLI